MDFVKRISKIANQVGDLITDELRNRIDRTEKLIEKREYNQAINELNDILKQRPDQARVLYLCGLCYQHRKQPGDQNLARQHFEQALAVNPQFIQSYLALGQLHEENQEKEQAIFCYQTALLHTREPQLMHSFLSRLGVLFYTQGLYLKAIRDLQKAESYQSHDASVLGFLGLAWQKQANSQDGWMKKKSIQTSFDYLQRAVQKDCAYQEVWIAYGKQLQQQKKYEESQKIFQECCIRFEQNSKSVLSLALLYQEQGLWELAQAQAQKVLSLEIGKLQETARDFLQNSPINNGSAKNLLHDEQFDIQTAFVIIAHSEEQKGFPERAFETYQKALLILPGLNRVLFQEVLLLCCRMNQFPRGIEFIKGDYASLPEGLVFQGLCFPSSEEIGSLEKTNLGNQSNEILNQAFGFLNKDQEENKKGKMLVFLACAYACKQKGLWEQAISWLERANIILPTDRTAHICLKNWSQELSTIVSGDFQAFLKKLEVSFQKTSTLSSFLPQLQEKIAAFSAPLLIAVSGEFNAGKSTFLNAWLGEEILKAGITPTTSIVQKLVYAPEKKCTLFYQDGSQKELTGSAFPTELHQVIEDEHSISWIQIGYPIEMLKQVNLVDTPGFNSVNPDHEQRTREFLQQADALIWVFSVDQPGKQTEKQVLSWFYQQVSGEIIGILNKIDRIGTNEGSSSVEESLAKILAHIQKEEEGVGLFIKDIIPFSGRDALLGIKYNEPKYLEKSRIQILQNTLEEKLYSRALYIKQKVAKKHIHHLLTQSLEQTKLSQAEINNLLQEITAIETLERIDRKGEEFCGQERKELLRELKTLYQTLAQEVLQCVRPGGFFGKENEITSFDRDFLLETAQQLLEKVFHESLQRMKQQLEVECKINLHQNHPKSQKAEKNPHSISSLTEVFVGEQLSIVYQTYLSFTRGYLEKENMNELFYQILPKMDRVEVAIARVLEQKFPTTIELLEKEFFFPLGQFWHHFFLQQKNQQVSNQQDLQWQLFQTQVCLYEPLVRFQQELERF